MSATQLVTTLDADDRDPQGDRWRCAALAVDGLTLHTVSLDGATVDPDTAYELQDELIIWKQQPVPETIALVFSIAPSKTADATGSPENGGTTQMGSESPPNENPFLKHITAIVVAVIAAAGGLGAGLMNRCDSAAKEKQALVKEKKELQNKVTAQDKSHSTIRAQLSLCEKQRRNKPCTIKKALTGSKSQIRTCSMDLKQLQDVSETRTSVASLRELIKMRTRSCIGFMDRLNSESRPRAPLGGVR